MGADIPDWLKKSASVVDKQKAGAVVVQQIGEEKRSAWEQKVEQERLYDVNRLMQEGERALELWRSLDVNTVMEGIVAVFDAAGVNVELDRPVLKFKGLSAVSTFEAGWCIPGYGQVISLGEILSHRSKSTNLEDTRFENITQKIYRVWETIEGHGGEGEHPYSVKHRASLFIVRLQNDGIWVCAPEGDENKPFIRIFSLNENSNPDDLKVVVDDFVSKII